MQTLRLYPKLGDDDGWRPVRRAYRYHAHHCRASVVYTPTGKRRKTRPVYLIVNGGTQAVTRKLAAEWLVGFRRGTC
jgi:hypothetical protein